MQANGRSNKVIEILKNQKQSKSKPSKPLYEQLKSKSFDMVAGQLDLENSKVAVTSDNFLELQGNVVMIRSLQIQLLQDEGVGDEIIQAFQESDLYKKCKEIENQLEEFKRKNFGDTMPNFSSDLKSEDLEITGNRNRKMIKEQITEATKTLVDDNSFNSLEPSIDNQRNVKVMTIISDPIALALISSSGRVIDLMKEKPFNLKAARVGGKVGLLATASLVTALVFGLAVPVMTAALGGTVSAGIASLVAGGMVTGTSNMVAGQMGEKLANSTIQGEDCPEKTDRVNKIKSMKTDDKITISLLKQIKTKEKELKELESRLSVRKGM